MTGLDFLVESYDSSRPASGILVARVAMFLITSLDMPVILALCPHQSATETDEAKLILEAKRPISHPRRSCYTQKVYHDSLHVRYIKKASGQHEGDRAKPSQLKYSSLWRQM